MSIIYSRNRMMKLPTNVMESLRSYDAVVVIDGDNIASAIRHMKREYLKPGIKVAALFAHSLVGVESYVAQTIPDWRKWCTLISPPTRGKDAVDGIVIMILTACHYNLPLNIRMTVVTHDSFGEAPCQFIEDRDVTWSRSEDHFIKWMLPYYTTSHREYLASIGKLTPDKTLEELDTSPRAMISRHWGRGKSEFCARYGVSVTVMNEYMDADDAHEAEMMEPVGRMLRERKLLSDVDYIGFDPETFIEHLDDRMVDRMRSLYKRHWTGSRREFYSRYQGTIMIFQGWLDGRRSDIVEHAIKSWLIESKRAGEKIDLPIWARESIPSSPVRSEDMVESLMTELIRPIVM